MAAAKPPVSSPGCRAPVRRGPSEDRCGQSDVTMTLAFGVKAKKDYFRFISLLFFFFAFFF